MKFHIKFGQHFIGLLFFKKKKLLGLVGNLKEIQFFRSNNLFFFYLKVDLCRSLNGQGTDSKKCKISRIKATIIYETSKYRKLVKNLEFQEIFQFSNLNNSLQDHFNPKKLYIF